MRIVDAGEMRALDHQAIEELGLPALVLMENAGRAIAEEVLRFCFLRGKGRLPQRSEGSIVERHAGNVPLLPRGDDEQFIQPEVGDSLGTHEHWVILVGKGNNGGDGIVCARHLRDAGASVTLLYVDSPEHFVGEAKIQYEIAQRLGLAEQIYQPGTGQLAAGYTGIVDALLGTGTRGAPRGKYASLIREANLSGLPIIAADIPSGLNADTGQVEDPCIQARITVTLAFLKAGLTQYPGAESAGDVVVRYIGIPPLLAKQSAKSDYLLTEKTLREELGVRANLGDARDPNGHKGTYGHVLIAAGSLGMSGAGLLASRAALRSGCGLVTWALPAGIVPGLLGAAPEVLLAGLGESGAEAFSAAAASEVLRLLEARDSLAVGPGIGRFPGDAAFLRALWEGARQPLVADADALNILAAAGGSAAFPRRDAATILTPHPGEMARLAGVTVAEVQQDRIGLARRYAVEHGVTLVLKGARTVVASPEGRVFVNTNGNAGMATGGSGDVLTGIIAGLLAQGLEATAAAAYGVYLHGAAGDKAARRRGHAAAPSLIAGDLIEAL